MKIETHDADRLGTALAKQVADNLRTAIQTDGWASIAVPGGTTPAPFLAALGAEDLDWRKVVVTLTDERCVPVDHERSNQALVSKYLLQGAARDARFVSLNTENDTIDTVAAALKDHVLPLTVCVLGMGDDMHTASLFPGTPGLADLLDPKHTDGVAAVNPPGADEARITLTAQALSSAAHTYLLIKGSGKREALDRAMTIEATAPIRAVLDAARAPVIYYAD